MAASFLNEEIDRLAFYNLRPVIFHGYVFPFVFIYSAWLYTWTVIYGIDDYFEAGCIAFAVIGLLQILTALFCLWSVHVRCALTCGKVSETWITTVYVIVILKN